MTALDRLRTLKTGDIVPVGIFGRCRFVRLRNRRAMFIQGNGTPLNIWLDWTDPTPPPEVVGVRAIPTPPDEGARSDEP